MDALQSLRPRFAKLGRWVRRWSGGSASQEQRARWDALQAHGEALERLTTSPEWVALVERKEVHQRMRDLLLRTPSVSDDARRQAAIEWNALDEFFREVTRSIHEGQKAKGALAHTTPAR